MVCAPHPIQFPVLLGGRFCGRGLGGAVPGLVRRTRSLRVLERMRGDGRVRVGLMGGTLTA